MWEFSPGLLAQMLWMGQWARMLDMGIVRRLLLIFLLSPYPDPQVSSCFSLATHVCCEHICQVCRTSLVGFVFACVAKPPMPFKTCKQTHPEESLWLLCFSSVHCRLFVRVLFLLLFWQKRSYLRLKWLAGLLRACGEDFLNLGISCCEKSSLC